MKNKNLHLEISEIIALTTQINQAAAKKEYSVYLINGKKVSVKYIEGTNYPFLKIKYGRRKIAEIKVISGQVYNWDIREIIYIINEANSYPYSNYRNY